MQCYDHEIIIIIIENAILSNCKLGGSDKYTEIKMCDITHDTYYPFNNLTIASIMYIAVSNAHELTH